MLLAIDAGNTNCVFAPLEGRMTCKRGLGAALIALALGACVPMTDQQRYERHLKCEVLSRGQGMVRAHMSERNSSRFEGFNRQVRAELDHSARVIGKRSDEVLQDGEVYLQELRAGLSSPRREEVIQEAVRVIEDCISGIYD